MAPGYYRNRPTATPDLEFQGRRAWQIPMDPEAPHWRADWNATVAIWLVEAPGSHPFWWWYCVSVVHLRELEGQSRPPVIHFPGATHEVLFVALNPEQPLPDLEDWKDVAFLTPPDLTHQVILPDDEAAVSLGRLAVQGIVTLGMSPDVDNRAAWQKSLDSTAEHLRLGGHPE